MIALFFTTITNPKAVERRTGGGAAVTAPLRSATVVVRTGATVAAARSWEAGVVTLKDWTTWVTQSALLEAAEPNNGVDA